MTVFSVALNTLLLYLSGRLFFYDIRVITENTRPRWRSLLARYLWSLVAFALFKNLETALIVCLGHVVWVTMDTRLFFRPHSLSTYIIHNLLFLLSLIILPLSRTFLTETPNPMSAAFPGLPELWAAGLAGMVFSIKEATIWIRLILNTVKATPPDAAHPEQQDKAEYERGRLIGVLERLLFYFMILFNQIGAIAIVVALKSLARFKALDNRAFAEYFLIGSLLSLILAALPALGVLYIKSVLP
ncbi:MAG: hypothetical protein D6677_02220 [Calditrichaeota bacterium]|nr:MAG: hypothetical protein D6677_02220 [Calditrichota bacterium]